MSNLCNFYNSQHCAVLRIASSAATATATSAATATATATDTATATSNATVTATITRPNFLLRKGLSGGLTQSIYHVGAVKFLSSYGIPQGSLPKVVLV